MKKSIYFLIKRALIPVFLLMITIVQAQIPIAQFKIMNDTLLDSKNFQFDVYIRNKPGTTFANFNLTSYTTAYKDSLPLLINGGTMSGSFIAGSSQLLAGQLPYAASVLFSASNANPKYVYHGGIASTTSATPLDTNWVRMFTMKLTNSVDYSVGRVNLNFYGTTAGGMKWILKYYNGSTYSNDAMTVVDTTTFKPVTTTTNPYLNKAIAKFNVTGSGSYASGGAGLPVGLDGSEIGCAYKLQLNNVTIPGLNEIVGTGAALTWGNQTAGTYTVVARRIATYEKDTLMNSSAIITIASSNAPDHAGAIHGLNPVCQGQGIVTYYTNHIQYADNSVWTYSGTGAPLIYVNDTTVTLNFGTNASSGGYLAVCGNNSMGHGPGDSIQITVHPLPTIGTILGNASVTSGTSETYTVPSIANATSYNWTYSGTGATYGAGLSFPATTLTDTLVMTFASTGASGGNLIVTGVNACGSTISPAFAISVAAAPPAGAGTIVGTANPCQGANNVMYTVPPIAGVYAADSGYVWNYSGTGATIVKSVTGDTIYVSYSTTASNGILTVKGKNINDYGTVSPDFSVTVGLLPVAAGTISGTPNGSSPCLNIPTTYSVASVANATSYIWTRPGGTTLMSADSITNTSYILKFTTAGIGAITVKGHNACGNGAVATFADTALTIPTGAPTITGAAFSCQGTASGTNVPYSLTTVLANATSYIWTLPTGVYQNGTTQSIDTTLSNSINVDFVNFTGTPGNVNYSGGAHVDSTIKVRGLNKCGLSSSFSTTVSIFAKPLSPSVITGLSPMCQGDSAMYRIDSIPYATSYVWSTNAIGATFSPSAYPEADSVKVYYATNAVSGNITVKGHNSCSDSPTTSTLAVIVNPLPIAPGTITGASTVCPGQNSVTYTINKVTGATDYSWILPAGFTGNSTDTTISINITSPLASGNDTIRVMSHNSCGNSTKVIKVVTVNPVNIINTMTKSSCSGIGFSVTPLNGTNGTVISGSTYSWSAPAGTGFTGGAASSGPPTTITGTLTDTTRSFQLATYTVTPKTPLGCSSTPFLVIDTVNPAPAITTIVNAACTGVAFTVTPHDTTNGIVPNGTTYSWLIPGGSGFTGGAAGSGSSITGTLANTNSTSSVALYNVTPTSGLGCAGAAFTVRDTVYPKPNISAMPYATCSGTAFTLTPVNGTNGTVPAGTTYSWNSPAVTGGISGGASGSNASSITGTLTNPSNTTSYTATYNVTPTAGTCVASSAFVATVTVNYIPVMPTATSPIGYCLNASAATLTTLTGTSLKWYNASGTLLGSAPTPLTTSVGTTNYYVTQTLNGCESPKDTIIVNVTSPALPTVTHMYYCNNAIADPLVATGTTGATIKWYNVASGGTAIATPTPSTAIVKDVIYWATQTISSCESSRAADTTTIYAVPPAPTSSLPAPGWYCQGVPAPALTATGTGGTIKWYDVPSGGTPLPSAPIPVTTDVAMPGPTYYVSQTLNGCESQRTPDQVLVLPTPTAPDVSDVSYCQNATPSQLSANGSNDLWYTAPTGGVGNSTAPTPQTTIADTVHYYVTQTDGCESPRAMIKVIVIATPPMPTFSDVAYCQGVTPSQLTATAATGGTLKWYAYATGGSSSSNAPTPPTTSVTTLYYYVSQTVNGCESARAKITVTINAIPSAPTFTTPPTYCQFATAAPLSANSQGLLWYQYAATGTGSSTATTPVTTLVGVFDYYVSQTVNGCESPRADIKDTVNGTSVPIASNPSAYCQGETAALLSATATANGILNWYFTPTGGTASSIAPIPSTLIVGDSNYYVSQTINGCESPRDTIKVKVNPIPPAPTSVNPGAYCQGATASILTTQSGANLLWYTTATGGTGSASTPTPSTLIVGDSNYYVSQTALGCESPRDTITVTVNPIPAKPDVTTPVVYCQNAFASALTTNSGSSLLWYTTPTEGIGSFTAPMPQTTTAGSIDYYVSQTLLGCESSRATITVTVDTIAAITAMTDIVCSGNMFTVTPLNGTNGVVPIGTTYTWSAPVVTGGLTGGVTSSGNPTHISGTLTNLSDTVETATYTVTPTSGNCTGNPFTVTVSVKPTPAVNSSSIGTVCSGVAQNYTVTSTVSNTTYNWSRAAVTGISNSAVSNQISNPITEALNNTTNAPLNVIYLITPTANSCSGTQFTYTVTVNPTSTINTSATGTVCNGVPQNYDITSTVSGSTYSWSRAVVTGISNPVATNQTSNPITEVLTNTTNAPVNVIYLITPTANACSGTTFTYTVTVNPTPAVNSSANGTVCSGAAQNYTITSTVSNTSYNWSRAAVTGISNSAVSNQISNPITEALNNTTNAPVNVIYLITPTANTCAGTQFTYTVTVDPTPIVNSSATGTVCSGVAQNYDITSTVSGSTYSWSRAVVTGISNPVATNQTSNPITETLNNTTNAPVNVIYLITPTANTCAGTTFTYTVTVNPTPAVNSSSNGTVCTGLAQNYSITSTVSNTSYNWSRALVTGISNTAVTNQISNPITEVLNNTTNAPVNVIYLITPTANTCSGTQFTYTVTVNALPAAAGAITGILNNTICTGSTGSVSVPTITGATSYVWSFAPTGLITGTSTTATLGLTAGSTTGIDTIKVHGTNTCGSGTYSSLVVAVITTPGQPTIVELDNAVVPHQGVTKLYRATPYYPAVSGVTYTWSSTTTRVTLLNATSDTVSVTFLADSAITGYLKVHLSDQCGTSPNDSIHWTITGINEYINNLSYHIYPNPTNGLLNIEIDGISENIELSIINAQGKLISTESISKINSIFKKEMDLSTYARGIYFVRIINKDFVKVEKVVVQ